MDSLPQKIFIVRHSEREDHKDPSWYEHAERPHDPPITQEGKTLGFKLGHFLVSQRRVVPSNVIILSSPLQRCVQTSHSIVEGMTASANVALETVPVHLEPGLIEGVYWMGHDINKAHSRRKQSNNSGGLKGPHPVYMPVEWLRSHVSPLVRSERFGLCDEPVYSIDEKTGALREAVHVAERCQRSAQALATSGLFSGKTVICVGHGETTKVWFDALSSLPCDVRSPPYTGIAELAPTTASAAEQPCRSSVVWIPQMAPFRQPHLDT
jgi:hypothetical protein